MANDDFPRTAVERVIWDEALSLVKGVQGTAIELTTHKRFDNLTLEIKLTCEAYGHHLGVCSAISLHDIEKANPVFLHFEIIHEIKSLVFKMNDFIKDYAFEYDSASLDEEPHGN